MLSFAKINDLEPAWFCHGLQDLNAADLTLLGALLKGESIVESSQGGQGHIRTMISPADVDSGITEHSDGVTLEGVGRSRRTKPWAHNVIYDEPSLELTNLRSSNEGLMQSLNIFEDMIAKTLRERDEAFRLLASKSTPSDLS